MNKMIIGLACLMITALSSGPAAAWFHAGRFGAASGGGGSWHAEGFRGGSASGGGGSWHGEGFRGGSASGGGGSWSGEGFRGGSASGGEGSWHAEGAYGGSASGGEGSWNATNRYGTTIHGGYDHYYGGTYATYHPPTVVNRYYGSGCYHCGGWSTAGAAAVGLAAGTAVGAASARAASADAYAMGGIYTTLPAGCTHRVVSGTTYYHCAGVWFKPSYGANGVYYRVVPASEAL